MDRLFIFFVLCTICMLGTSLLYGIGTGHWEPFEINIASLMVTCVGGLISWLLNGSSLKW